MKKIFYAVIPAYIALSGCASMMTTTVQYDPGQSSNANYDPPANNYPNNTPPPAYGYQQGNYNYDNSPQTDQVFYDELSPYGDWIDYPGYGYVWSPNTGGDFTPYATNGYWVYSDYGWTWVSNYRWGWAPFHYGRWFYDDNNGWLWVPGHEWAPAWVTWATYGQYYCWAPLAPRVDVRYISSRSGWTPPGNSWSVVPARRLTQPNMTNYIVKTNATVINNVTIINNVTNNYNTGQRGDGRQSNGPVTYNRGPRVNEVENFTNTRVQSVKVNDNTRPGAQTILNNQLLVYRPVIKTTPQQGNAQPAPHRVGALRQMRDPNRNNPGQQNTQPDGNQQDQRQGRGQNTGQRRSDQSQDQQYQRQNGQQQQNTRSDQPQQQNQQDQRQNNNRQPGMRQGTDDTQQQNQQDQRPNNSQQQQGMRPGTNQPQQQNQQGQRPNDQQRSGMRPGTNQPQQQNQQDQRSNNGGQQQNTRPGAEKDTNQQHTDQPKTLPGRNNFWQMKPRPQNKLDTTKRRIQKID